MSAELDAWDRLAGILDLQLAALDRPEPDMDRFRELAQARTDVQGVIDRLRGRGPASEPAPPLRTRMEGCRRADQAILSRLTHIRKETAAAIQRSGDRAPGRAGYLAGAHAVAASRPQRIDVRS